MITTVQKRFFGCSKMIVNMAVRRRWFEFLDRDKPFELEITYKKVNAKMRGAGVIPVGKILVPQSRMVREKFETLRFTDEDSACSFLKSIKSENKCLKCGDVGNCTKKNALQRRYLGCSRMIVDMKVEYLGFMSIFSGIDKPFELVVTYSKLNSKEDEESDRESHREFEQDLEIEKDSLYFTDEESAHSFINSVKSQNRCLKCEETYQTAKKISDEKT